MPLRFRDFDLDGVRRVIAELPGTEFYSDVVVDDPRVRNMQHPTPDQEHTYRRMVGQYLIQYDTDLGVQWLDYGKPKRGSRWRKR